MSHEDVVRRYCHAVATRDFDTAEALRHARWLCEWPQSGERVTSSEAMREIGERYPGGGYRAVERRIRGSEDSYEVTPMGTIVRTAGAGETWTAEWINRYPDGREYFVVDIITLKDGLVLNETTYWSEPFEPPEWRRRWVELGEPG